MLSAHLFITRKHRIRMFKHIGFSFPDDNISSDEAPNVWLRSAKISIYGEGLADKGFEHADLSFANFNQVRTPMMLRNG